MKYWDVLAEYDAETQAYSAAVGVIASPYRPKSNGRLVGIRVIVNAQAATTLTRGVLLRLTSVSFQPVNTITLAVAGPGLMTAPSPQPPQFDFEVNQPVNTGSDITIEGRAIEATHVTNSILVLGCFE